MEDKLNLDDGWLGNMGARGSITDGGHIKGRFTFTLTDANGNVLYDEVQDNTVVNVGQGLILTASLAGSSYTALEYMGLISSVGFSAIAATDTMSSHSGWNEVQNTGTNTPPYGTTRPTATYSSTTNGTISCGSNNFVFTGSGTVEGGFIVGGSGASATVGNTGGTLIAAGTLSTAQPVISGNTLQMTHTLTL